jgi:hypothetical protein
MKWGVLFVASLFVISSGIAVTIPSGTASTDALACPSYVCTIDNGEGKQWGGSGPSGFHHAFCQISDTMDCEACCNSCMQQLWGLPDWKIVGYCGCSEADDFSFCD